MFDTLNCLIEVILFLFLMKLFCCSRLKYIMLCPILGIFSIVLFKIQQQSLFLDTQYFLLTIACYMTVTLCLFYKQKSSFLITSIYFSLLYLFQIIIFNIIYHINSQFELTLSKTISLVILFIIILVCKQKISILKTKFETFQSHLLLRSALLILLSVSFLYSGIIVLLDSANTSSFLMIFMELIAIVFLLFSISKQYYQTQKDLFELQQQEQLIQIKNENQEIKAQNDLELTHIRHEIKNQILTLEYLLKENKYQEATNFIEGLHSDALYKKIVDTNNEVINAICNNKVYHHPNIHFDFQMQFQQLNINNHELISLIGNALDNAIEYLDHTNKDKTIALTIQQTQDFYIFIIKNNIYNFINTSDLSTTKEDKKHHGFGIKIMKDIIEKHNGSFEIETRDTEFIVSMLIPILQ